MIIMLSNPVYTVRRCIEVRREKKATTELSKSSELIGGIIQGLRAPGKESILKCESPCQKASLTRSEDHRLCGEEI